MTIEKKIAIPPAMLQAGRAQYSAYVTAEEGARRILEAALGWLSENPRKPTLEQWRDCVCDIPEVEYPSTEEMGIAQCVEWQRRMFAAPDPEVPEEIKDLIFGDGTFPRDQGGVDACIVEAFRRGQKAARR